jgi:diguanylate cyclase (GGDEF)-like protein/PAS domain S-box-containing protein
VNSLQNPTPRQFGFTLLGWSLLIVMSLLYNVHREEENTLITAMAAARAAISKDIGFRKWGASHGGVYVPPTKRTPPNPYLQVPDRDVVTTSGHKLTLMNPAYMLRQLQHDFGAEFGILSRITSLNPLNPANAPDDWEAKALASFATGTMEFLELQSIQGEPYLRMMAPLKVEEGCLKCHAQQGYQIGDIRGGIGTAIRLQPYYAQETESVRALTLTHGGIWWIGFLGIALYFRRENRLSQVRAREERRLAESEFLFRTLFEAENIGVAITSPEKGWVRVNPRLCQILGYGKEELKQKTWAEITYPEDLAADLAQFERLLAGKLERYELDKRFVRKDGSLVYTRLTVACYRSRGKVQFVIAGLLDITERMRAQAELQKALRQAERFRDALDQVPTYVYMKDKAHRYLYANQKTLQLFGCSPEELIGCDDTRFFNPDVVRRLWEVDARVFAGENTEVEFESCDPSGNCRVYWEVKTPIYDEGHPPRIVGLCGISTDITELKRLQRLLEKQAHTDHLTGVYNRGYFIARAEQELNRAARYDSPLSLLMLDLDFFKQVNDRHGHKMGDNVLKKLGEVCQQSLREADIIGRLGGEEFAVLLPETGPNEARETAERLRLLIDAIRVPLEHGSLPLRITVSIGVAVLATREDNLDMLLERADQALYLAKEAGRNRVCVAN